MNMGVVQAAWEASPMRRDGPKTSTSHCFACKAQAASCLTLLHPKCLVLTLLLLLFPVLCLIGNTFPVEFPSGMGQLN